MTDPFESRVEAAARLICCPEGCKAEKPQDPGYVTRLPCSALHERATARAILEATEPLLAASIARWSDPSFMQLHAGEMTAQERRTVAAVVNAIVAELKRGSGWGAIRGAAPDATGGLPSEDFVRETRDAWDRTDPCPVCRGEGWELMTVGDTPPRWRECVECGNPEKRGET